VIKEGKMKEKSSFSCWGIQFHREKKREREVILWVPSKL
jgi:hypothetical protein